MQKLAKMERRSALLPRTKRDNRPKTRPWKATEGTIAIMRALTKGDASTWELAQVTGVDRASASSRLRALRRAEVVEVTGRTQGARHCPNHIWTLGPNAAKWLARYGVVQ